MITALLRCSASALSLLGAPHGTVRRTAPSIYPAQGEKYPGQRNAYLVGAWQPMTAAEILAHNAKVEATK